MASMRDIKRRKESVQSTEQITKAMKLVSSVKLTKAKQNAEESKPYFDSFGYACQIRHREISWKTREKSG